jgi:hypothetical protein
VVSKILSQKDKISNTKNIVGREDIECLLLNINEYLISLEKRNTDGLKHEILNNLNFIIHIKINTKLVLNMFAKLKKNDILLAKIDAFKPSKV